MRLHYRDRGGEEGLQLEDALTHPEKCSQLPCASHQATAPCHVGQQPHHAPAEVDGNPWDGGCGALHAFPTALQQGSRLPFQPGSSHALMLRAARLGEPHDREGHGNLRALVKGGDRGC